MLVRFYTSNPPFFINVSHVLELLQKLHITVTIDCLQIYNFILVCPYYYGSWRTFDHNNRRIGKAFPKFTSQIHVTFKVHVHVQNLPSRSKFTLQLILHSSLLITKDFLQNCKRLFSEESNLGLDYVQQFFSRTNYITTPLRMLEQSLLSGSVALSLAWSGHNK